MFFPKKRHKTGDCRVVRRFAVFPKSVVDSKHCEVGTIWLEKYDRVEMSTYMSGWEHRYNAPLGQGAEVARYIAKLYDGKFIGEDE